MPTLLFGLGPADLLLSAAALGAALACIWLALGTARGERAGLARAAATRQALDNAETSLTRMEQRLDSLAERQADAVERIEAELATLTGSSLDRRIQSGTDELGTLLRAEIAAAIDGLAETLRREIQDNAQKLDETVAAQADRQAEAIASATAVARDEMSQILADEAAALLSTARERAAAAADAACADWLAKAIAEEIQPRLDHMAETAREQTGTALDALLPPALDAILTQQRLAPLIAGRIEEALTAFRGEMEAPPRKVSNPGATPFVGPSDRPRRIETSPTVVGVFQGRSRKG